MFKKNLIVLCFLTVAHSLFAQQFGGNPPSISWKQINTDTARIIFPNGMDSTARRISNIVHWLAKNNPASLGNQLHKINIVLQSQTTVSNGYVSLAPFRSEYFLTPPLNNFDLGSINWPELLAVHEFRHVEQFNNFRNGISNAIYYLLGEDGLLVAINAAVPDWFYEGDAVYNETVTTSQGRGRVPFFLNTYKSLLDEQKVPSVYRTSTWMKLRNGSLKDYIPDYYPLGYIMVNYGREKYGTDFWTKVTRDASAFKGIVYPFQKAVKKYSGVDYKTFRKNAFDYFEKLSGIDSTGNGTLNGASQGTVNQGTEAGIKNITAVNAKIVTDHYFPYQVNEDSLLYVKLSYRKLHAFYLKDRTGEHKLRTRDISIDQQFSYRNGKIVYAAFESDPRWSWRDFSVIRILDIHTGLQRTLLHKTKYFTPDLSPAGNSIAAVQVQTGGKSELHILDARNGNIIQRFHSADISLFTDPKFIDDNTLVTAVRLNDGRMSLAIADVKLGSIERLTVPSYGIVGYPSIHDGIIYFTASFTGNDELYALQLADKKIFRITRSTLGNYFVNASANKLVWSAFTSDGFQLKETAINKSGWTEMTELEITKPTVEYPVALPQANGVNEPSEILLAKVPARVFNTSKYKQGGHLFHFHSWRPYFEDPDFTYSVYSDNILNTLSTEFFYHYNRDDKTNGWGMNFLYGALYPYINGGLELTINQPVIINNYSTSYDKLEARIGLSIPLSFTSGRSLKFLNIGTNYVFAKQVFSYDLKDSTPNLDFGYLHHFLSWDQHIPQAVQHIYPRLGYSISLAHRHATSLYNSYQFIGNASIYLPGFFATHSIVATASFQQRDTTTILFSNRFVNARGYEDYYLSRMWKVGANYHFPIAYPDWGLANIVYFQRIRGNAFFDFERVYSKDKLVTRDLRSVGGELYFDTKWWNQYPLTFGIRFSHLLDAELSGSPRTNRFEILIPIVIPQ